MKTPDSVRQKQLDALRRLLDIMDDLRSQCPWDKEQTMQSLRHLTIEETYELGEAILNDDLEEVKKELGDLLLHIVFYAKIGSEKEAFDIADVAHTISDKLVERHPHIYGDVKVQNAGEVKRNWEKLKMKEGRQSVLEGVPKSLPALVKSTRIQEKAAGTGFEWENKEQVWEKVEEELSELRQAEKTGDKKKIASEFGDVLFALTNYARFLKVSPENALESANIKFINRFRLMEKLIGQDGKDLHALPLYEMEEYWIKTKKLFP